MMWSILWRREEITCFRQKAAWNVSQESIANINGSNTAESGGKSECWLFKTACYSPRPSWQWFRRIFKWGPKRGDCCQRTSSPGRRQSPRPSTWFENLFFSDVKDSSHFLARKCGECNYLPELPRLTERRSSNRDLRRFLSKVKIYIIWRFLI